MEEGKTTKQDPQAKPLGPSKREKVITGVIIVVLVVVLVIAALIQKFSGQ